MKISIFILSRLFMKILTLIVFDVRKKLFTIFSEPTDLIVNLF